MKAVIFDMDGVLVDSEPLHYESDLELLKRLGVTVPEGYLDQFVGVTNAVMWEKITADYSIDKNIEEILNAQLSLKLKLLKKADLKPIDGIPELLKRIRLTDYPIAVASSSSAIFIKQVLAKIGLDYYFDVFVSGESVPRSKPEPDVFLKAAAALGVNPEDCIVIEDSRNGTLAAKRAGMKCVGYRNPHPGNQDLSAAGLIVEDFKTVDIKTLQSLWK